MTLNAWLPIGHELPGGVRTEAIVQDHEVWQLYKTQEGGLCVVANESLGRRWLETGIITEPPLIKMMFGSLKLFVLHSSKSRAIFPIQHCRSPKDKSEAMAVALALRETRILDPTTSLHDAIYVERYSRLLPTYTLSPAISDDVVLGVYLTGGIPVSIRSRRRLESLLGWLSPEHLRQILDQAGFRISESQEQEEKFKLATGSESQNATPKLFALPGRPSLEKFFFEHVIDIIENHDKYATLGVDFPSAIVLHGPPGCGKTFAIERLIDYLGWPSFEINCGSIGSPYIHETGRKISEVFAQALKNAPSVIVIDEMEAFLADRGTGAGAGQHRVEEVGEFLRRIPEATKNRVLVVAMTNRVDMVDPAILRRGRFDHVVQVDMPSAEEVEDVLRKLTSKLPCESDLNLSAAALRLAGRPMSDISFVIRETSRLAARDGKPKLDKTSFESALSASPPRDGKDGLGKKIGFF